MHLLSTTLTLAINGVRILLLAALILSVAAPGSPASNYAPKQVSYRQTVGLYQNVPCLTAEELAYGKEVIRGLDYTAQRLFRKLCLLEGIDFSGCQRAWSLLIRRRLNFEQTLAFEAWSDLEAVDFQLALDGLAVIGEMGQEAGKAFRRYLPLQGVTADQALKLIPVLTSMADANNLALQALLQVQGMTAAMAVDCLHSLARLRDNQARACETLAGIADMDSSTMLDALPLLARLEQTDAWNARSLFLLNGMDRSKAWNWLVAYFAHPLTVQEQQYLGLSEAEQQQLLQAMFNGGEVVIWKINNLHAVTDRFGMEISAGRLRAMPLEDLRSRFNDLTPRTRVRFNDAFHGRLAAGDRGASASLLQQATAVDRVQTVRDLSTANIYALMAQGSELYDSSFRDILVPELKARLNRMGSGNLLGFFARIDPGNILVSSFIVSLAQKGKLADFFPADSGSQQSILDLVADSAFHDEETLLLFSASFFHLMEVLSPQSRSHLIRTMIDQAGRGRAGNALLISAILQFTMQEKPDLLSGPDRDSIRALMARNGNLDLDRYRSAPFAAWLADRQLTSISIYHPDDDGYQTFASNGRELLNHGYRAAPSIDYTIPSGQDLDSGVQALIRQTATGGSLTGLFRAMESRGFAVEFSKQLAGIRIRHVQVIYQGEQNQQEILNRFVDAGDEMLAQRGHSYWRSEQIIEPLTHLRQTGRITDADLAAQRRFLSLGSCGGVKAYSQLTRMFGGNVDILATIGTGLAKINDPYNRRLFEIVAADASNLNWQEVAKKMAPIFGTGRGQDYLQPGSLTSILHRMLHEQPQSPPSRHSRSADQG